MNDPFEHLTPPPGGARKLQARLGGDPFLVLAPPPGGLQLLRASLDARVQGRWIAMPAAASLPAVAALLALAWWARPTEVTPWDDGDHPALVAAVPLDVHAQILVREGGTPVLAVPLAAGDVAFYWVAPEISPVPR